MDHQELLDAALTRNYCNHLLNMEWDIYEESYNETVDKIELIEPEIKAEAPKDKEILELKRKKLMVEAKETSAVAMVLKT